MAYLPVTCGGRRWHQARTGLPLTEYHIAGDRTLAQKITGARSPGAPDVYTKGGLMYYVYDGLGNVTGLTDRLGELITQYRYDAFGGLFTGATTPYNLIGPFGKEYDPASGLVYIGARWYDASVGLFTTPDPFPGFVHDPVTLHPYILAKSNPVNYVDRWGLHVDKDRFHWDLPENAPAGTLGYLYLFLWHADGSTLHRQRKRSSTP